MFWESIALQHDHETCGMWIEWCFGESLQICSMMISLRRGADRWSRSSPGELANVKGELPAAGLASAQEVVVVVVELDACWRCQLQWSQDECLELLHHLIHHCFLGSHASESQRGKGTTRIQPRVWCCQSVQLQLDLQGWTWNWIHGVKKNGMMMEDAAAAVMMTVVGVQSQVFVQLVVVECSSSSHLAQLWCEDPHSIQPCLSHTMGSLSLLLHLPYILDILDRCCASEATGRDMASRTDVHKESPLDPVPAPSKCCNQSFPLAAAAAVAAAAAHCCCLQMLHPLPQGWMQQQILLQIPATQQQQQHMILLQDSCHSLHTGWPFWQPTSFFSPFSSSCSQFCCIEPSSCALLLCCSDALSVSLYFFLPCINITSWRR